MAKQPSVGAEANDGFVRRTVSGADGDWTLHLNDTRASHADLRAEVRAIGNGDGWAAGATAGRAVDHAKAILRLAREYGRNQQQGWETKAIHHRDGSQRCS